MGDLRTIGKAFAVLPDPVVGSATQIGFRDRHFAPSAKLWNTQPQTNQNT